MIKVKLRDDVREFENGVSVMEVAKSLGAGLFKAACLAKVDGITCDLRTVLNKDCEVEILTTDDTDGLKAFWHTASHILAQAVKRLYPGVKLAIGPAIDNGFYYDFDFDTPFTPEELTKIEAEMK
ncbi:MAG: TGS domain-containing protein, partial [Acutalibacteraceae bacterium]